MKYIYKVGGRGAFPWDMLRYDGCHPVSQLDVENLHGKEDRVVLLSGVRAPTIERWNSFRWGVIIVEPRGGQ